MCWTDCFLCCLSLQSGAMFVAAFGMTAGLLGFLLMPFMPFSGEPGDDFRNIMFYMFLLMVGHAIVILSTMFESKLGLTFGIVLICVAFIVWALLTIPSFIESSGNGCLGLRCGESHWLVPRQWSPMTSFSPKLFDDNAGMPISTQERSGFVSSDVVPISFQERADFASLEDKLQGRIDELKGRTAPIPVEFNRVDVSSRKLPIQKTGNIMPKYLQRNEQKYLQRLEEQWEQDYDSEGDNEINTDDNDKENPKKDAKKSASKPLKKSALKPKKGTSNKNETGKMDQNGKMDELVEKDLTGIESINETNKENFQILIERLEKELVKTQGEIETILKTVTPAGIYLNNSLEEDKKDRRKKREFLDDTHDTSKESNIDDDNPLNKTENMIVNAIRTDVERSTLDCTISSIKTRNTNENVITEVKKNFLDDILTNKTVNNLLHILANDKTILNGEVSLNGLGNGLKDLPLMMAQLRLLKLVHRQAKRDFNSRQISDGDLNDLKMVNRRVKRDFKSGKDTTGSIRSLPQSTVDGAINLIEPISKLLAIMYLSMFLCGLATLLMYWSNMFSTIREKPDDCVLAAQV